jgi:hypothetical protein
MKVQDMSMEALLAELAANFSGELEVVDPREFDKPSNVINMPLKTYITMSERHAIKVHLRNLVATFGINAVRTGIEEL